MNTRLLPALIFLCSSLLAASGDPQLKTDHPWYPGELSCSNFERLFKTQAELYTRVTGKPVATDEDKALAAWYWRNLNYAHGEEGAGDYWDKGFGKGGDSRTREYWLGLFGHGFGLCGTTHSQWTVELDNLLGPCRGRAVGVTGHNSFEVYLTGGPYKNGSWALLDHDVSTVIFSHDGIRLLSIKEVMADLKTLKNPNFKPERQRGWRVAGLHDDDAATYSTFACAEYVPGYAGPPPMVHLRAGESLRRYLKPGLEDGKTYVFWGMNYKTGGVPGLERSRSWVNQPEKMYGSKKGTGWVAGQVRFANAVYTYVPDFKGGAYKEGVIDETNEQVTFEFYTPYIIGCTPPNDKAWGIYDAGGKNGLVVSGKASCAVRVSTDQGKTWTEPATLSGELDLTDHVKGHQQYWIRFGADPKTLAEAGIKMRTVCQCNVATIPHLRDGDNKITFVSSGLGLLSAGPNKDQAQAHVVDGGFGQKTVTLELAPPRKEVPVEIYASSWQASGSPPGPTKFQIEYSVDKGQTWQTMVKDWQVIRREPEPTDFWSQSMCYGKAKLDAKTAPGTPVRVRFKNDGGKQYLKAEAHLLYRVNQPGATEVTFAWKEADGAIKNANHVYPAGGGVEDTSWTLTAGKGVETLYVEYTAK
ncbi:MAG TPA: hypothetical protein VEK08_21585 [Planctomycetota bacterium]|nr:hypothetical protein [Planctomycetota bacterium]